MKVSGIWRMVALLFIGFSLGAVVSTCSVVKYAKNNTPAGQEITIGKLKIKGNNNTDIIDIDATNEQTELSRRDKRRARRSN